MTSDDRPPRIPAWFEAELIEARPKLHKFCRTLYPGDPAAAEDLAQDAICNAVRFSKSYQRGTKMYSWLCQIARNCRYSAARRDWRVVTTPSGVIEDFVDQPIALHAGPGRLAVSELAEAMADLPSEMTEAVLAISFGDTYEEVAGRVGVAPGTIKSRASRGRAILRARLDA